MSLQPPLHPQWLVSLALPQTWLSALLYGLTETLVLMVYHLHLGLPDDVAPILHSKLVSLAPLDPASLEPQHFVGIELC